ncbi:hypothetical protein CFP56_036640 [Quercus suber]|uniref:Uncharacterized protein n=1 Tax=Quercus suber TaxID=58331 RepID=A0AAW0J638_QUESU
MATKLPVVTTDIKYWHTGCYMEEIYTKPQFLKFISECGMSKKAIESLAMTTTSPILCTSFTSVVPCLLSRSNQIFKTCKDDVGMVVHLLDENIVLLGANLSVSGVDLAVFEKSLNCLILVKQSKAGQMNILTEDGSNVATNGSSKKHEMPTDKFWFENLANLTYLALPLATSDMLSIMMVDWDSQSKLHSTVYMKHQNISVGSRLNKRPCDVENSVLSHGSSIYLVSPSLNIFMMVVLSKSNQLAIVKPKYFSYYRIRGTPNEPFMASLERIMVEQYKISFWCDINT